jgi:hypothetical protein
MPLNTENPYNSPFDLAPEDNKLLSAINASTLRGDDVSPDEFAMQSYRGPSFEPKGRILPTVKETAQTIGAIGGAVAGLVVGGVAEIGSFVNRKLGIDNVPAGAEIDAWAQKLGYYPTEPVAQRAVETFNLPFEGLRFIVDKVGHGVQDWAISKGMNVEDAANLGATISLGTEFGILKYSTEGFKKVRSVGGIKVKSAIGRLNEILRGEGGKEASIKDAISALKSAMKDEVPMENLSEVQKMALDQLTKQDEVPIVDYMDHIKEMTSEGLVNALKEKKNVSKQKKRTKVKADEMKVGDVKGATEIVKEAEVIEPIKETNIIEEVPTYKSRSGNVYTKKEGQWFDKDNNVVTNKTIVNAAERKQVMIKNIISNEPNVESKLNISELNSTGDSVEFSKVVTKEQLVEVERLQKFHGDEANKLIDEYGKTNDKTKQIELMNKAMEESTKSQLYREVIEAKNEPERFKSAAEGLTNEGLKLGEEEIPKPKITKSDKAEISAKAHGIKFISEELIEELLRETDTTPTKIPHYQFFDPVTGEYFLSRSPSAKVVGEELATLRELRLINENVNKKLTFEDFNREANDILNKKSNVKADDFLTTLREFTNNISEEDIGPGKRFETTADAIEHSDMGIEFANRFRREAIKKGIMKDIDVQLNMMIPLDQIPALVKDWYKLGKRVGKDFGEMFRDRELWLKTGFWLGKDGKWRYELDDSKAKLINITRKKELVPENNRYADIIQPINGKLSTFLDYPELYKEFPELKDIDIVTENRNSYIPTTKTITLDNSMLDEYDIFKELTHEVQHAVNHISGSKFRGSNLFKEAVKLKENYRFNNISFVDDSTLNIRAFGNYLKNPGELEARLTTKRRYMDESQRKSEAPWETLEKMTKEEFNEYSEGIGSTLYSGIPIHLVKDIAKDINRTFKAIYRGLSERTSVKGLKPNDEKVYNKMLSDHESATSSSEQRGVYEIGKDLETLEDFSANEKFNLEALKAIQLLESDAKRLKQPFNDYLTELGFTPEQVRRAMNESSKWKNKIEPLDETVPVDISPDESNPIVKQRQWKAKDKSILTAPPIYASDITMMEAAIELPPQVGFKTLGTMIRIFEDAGLKPIYNAWREADAMVAREGIAVDNFLNDIKGRYKLNRKNRQNIMTYAYQQQERGMAILEANKLKPVTLTPDELNAYSEMRTMFEDYFERINAVRRSIGREPIKKVDNYFTFARVINNLQREGIVNNLIREDAELIMNQYTHFKSTPFRFARTRTGGLFNPELDSFKVFKMYSDTTAKHINLSPVAAKVNELTNTRLPLSDGSGSVQYSVVKPNTGRFLNEWSDFISGKPVVSKWPGLIGDKGLRLLRKNIAYSTLQWNVRSFLIQPAAIQNSITELGLKYVSEGFVDNLKPEMRKLAMEKSNHLITRVPETEINDWAYVGKIWKAGFKPMQWTDLETARTTWLGAYKFGKEVNGLGGKELINFADDVVVRTQGSAGMGDIAAIQRSEMGKALTMFQTFTINNWDFITKDVLGLKGLKFTRPVDLQKVMRLVLATTAINILYEDVFGISSPNPRPVKELIDGISDGKSFGKIALSTAKELIEPVPIIGGSFKYGKQIGGPVFETLSNVGEKFTDRPMQKDWIEILSMASGVPGTRQVIKYQKGQKRGEGFVGSLLGTYSEQQGGTGRPSRSGRGSRGSR